MVLGKICANGKEPGFKRRFPLELATDTKFKNGESLGGNGLKNMHARADDVNAKLCINSIINEGTTIQLTLRL